MVPIELADQLDVEIECPRCKDVMELFSEFDYLSYYCGGCHLELNIHYLHTNAQRLTRH
jgi:phage FluMu protein Com